MASPTHSTYGQAYHQQGYPAPPDYINGNSNMPPQPPRPNANDAGRLSPNPYPPNSTLQGENAGYYSPYSSPNPSTYHVPSSHQQPYLPVPSPAASPVPQNDDLRQRLEAAGVSPAQISQVMDAPPSPQLNPGLIHPYNQPSPAAPPIQAMQNMTLSPPQLPRRHLSEEQMLADGNFPENWPADRAIVLENREHAPELEYVVPIGCSDDTRLYTWTYESRTQRLPDHMVIKGHVKRRPETTRSVGEIAFTKHGVCPSMSWQDWGEWRADDGRQTFSWSSDTGMFKDGEWLYWSKDFNKKQTGQVAVLTCKLYTTGKALVPQTDDKVVCKVEVADCNGTAPDIITIYPGYIKSLQHLDEMVSIAGAVLCKYLRDAVFWLHLKKGYSKADVEKLTDLSNVPEDVDGYGFKGFPDTHAKPSSKTKWRERGKLFKNAAELTQNLADLGTQIGIATGSN